MCKHEPNVLIVTNVRGRNEFKCRRCGEYLSQVKINDPYTKECVRIVKATPEEEKIIERSIKEYDNGEYKTLDVNDAEELEQLFSKA